MVAHRRIGPDSAFIREFTDVRKRVQHLETKPSGNIVIRETLTTEDPETGVKTIIGQLPDGSIGFQPFVGDITPPPVATQPIVTALPGTFTVQWDGLFVNNEEQPRDFEHVNVIGHKMSGTVTVLSLVVGVLRLPTETVYVEQDIAAAGETWQFSLESEDFNGNLAVRGARSPSVVMQSVASDASVNAALEEINLDVLSAQNAAVSAQNAANAAQQDADTVASNLSSTNTAVSAAQLKADQAFNNAASAATAAGNAQTTADGKNRNWYQPDQPAGTGHKVGDGWYDTDDNYKLRTWTGSIWQTTQDSWTAQQTADSKALVYNQPTTPPIEARVASTIWNDTSLGLDKIVQKYWNGSAWTALADKTATDAAASASTAMSAQSYSTNASFDDWTGTYPTGYTFWNSTPVKETAIVRRSPNALRFNVADTTAQAGLAYASIMSHAPNLEYFTVELEFYLVSGGLGQAGMILDWGGLSPNRAQINLFDEVPSPATGKWYRVVKTLRRPTTAAGTFTSMNGYLMGQWSGHTGGGAAKNIIFDWFNVRPASAEEILAFNSSSVAQAKADTAQAAAITAAQATTMLATAYSKNPSFDDWASTLPDTYSAFGAITPTKDTTNKRIGAHGLKFTVPGTEDAGINFVSNVSHMPNVEYITVELEFMLTSGTLAGAGVLLDWNGLTPIRSFVKLTDHVLTPVTGKWYKISAVVARPANATGTWTSMGGWLMANWNELGTKTAKTIIYDWLNVRPSTAEEITAYKAPAKYTELSAATTTAQASADGKNKVHYSTSPASGTVDTTDSNRPFVEGDTWFQRNAQNLVIGQWEFTGGAWVSRKVDGAVLANLDAGTIIVGYLRGENLSATAIDGKTITGALIQTDSTPVSAARGIKLTTTELAGYDSTGVKNFSLTTGGTLAIRGAIQSGSTITGTQVTGSDGIQTSTSATAGVKLTNTGIKAWDASNNLTFHLDATTGYLELPGLKANSINGDRIVAGSLQADKLLISNSSNAIVDPTFQIAEITAGRISRAAGVWTEVAGTTTAPKHLATTTTTTNNILQIAPFAIASNTRTNAIQVKAGQKWLLEVDVDTNISAGVRWNAYLYYADGTSSYLALSPYNTGTGKRTVSYVYDVPANLVAFYPSLACNTSGVAWKVYGNLYMGQQVGATMIENNSITTGKISVSGLDGAVITAGTLTAIQMKGKSITVDKLVVTSTDNLIVEADFGNGGSSWQTATNMSINATAGRGSLPAMRITGTTARRTSLNLVNKVAVGAEDRFRASMWVKSSTAAPSGIIKLGARAYTTATAYTDITLMSNSAFASGSYVNIDGVSPALPANTVALEFYLDVTPTSTAQVIDIDYVGLTRAADGRLVVDGAIDGKTITGALIQTSAAGSGIGRVVLDGTGIYGYDASGANYLTGNAAGLTLTGMLKNKGVTDDDMNPQPMTVYVGNLDMPDTSWDPIGIHFALDNKQLGTYSYVPPRVFSFDGTDLQLESGIDYNGDPSQMTTYSSINLQEGGHAQLHGSDNAFITAGNFIQIQTAPEGPGFVRLSSEDVYLGRANNTSKVYVKGREIAPFRYCQTVPILSYPPAYAEWGPGLFTKHGVSTGAEFISFPANDQFDINETGYYFFDIQFYIKVIGNFNQRCFLQRLDGGVWTTVTAGQQTYNAQIWEMSLQSMTHVMAGTRWRVMFYHERANNSIEIETMMRVTKFF